MSARDHRARARAALSGHWVMAVLVGLVAGLLGGSDMGSGGFDINIDLNQWVEGIYGVGPEVAGILLALLGTVGAVAVVYALAMLVLGGVIGLGYRRYCLNLIDGTEAEFGDLFSQFSRFLDAFVLYLLMGLFTFLWSLLLIVPGIVAAYSYSMAPYILLEDPGCTPLEAIRRSKEMMDGCKLDLFVLELSFIGWSLLSALTLGLGGLVLRPYINTAYASFYRYVSQGWTWQNNIPGPECDPGQYDRYTQ